MCRVSRNVHHVHVFAKIIKIHVRESPAHQLIFTYFQFLWFFTLSVKWHYPGYGIICLKKYFFYICIQCTCTVQFPQFFTQNNSFFTVFNNILNILNLCIDLLSLLRNYEDFWGS